MDKEEIKQAMDKFENDEYSDSKDILRQGIKNKVNSYLKTNLDMENDPCCDAEYEDEDEDDDDE